MGSTAKTRSQPASPQPGARELHLRPVDDGHRSGGGRVGGRVGGVGGVRVRVQRAPGVRSPAPPEGVHRERGYGRREVKRRSTPRMRGCTEERPHEAVASPPAAATWRP